MLRKVITWGLVIFVIYFLVSDPTGAGSVVHVVFNGMKSAGLSVSRFVGSL
jgi:hypothetical protein